MPKRGAAGRGGGHDHLVRPRSRSSAMVDALWAKLDAMHKKNLENGLNYVEFIQDAMSQVLACFVRVGHGCACCVVQNADSRLDR